MANITDNVVGLRGQPVSKEPKPDPEVIKELEWLLGRARDGQIVGFAAAWDYFDSAGGHLYCGRVSYSIVGRMHTLQDGIVGALKDA